LKFEENIVEQGSFEAELFYPCLSDPVGHEVVMLVLFRRVLILQYFKIEISS
jgi:hypothetical protein